MANAQIQHDLVCKVLRVFGQQRMKEIDLETHTVSRSGWLFYPRPQRHCSVANERPKLHANIRLPCGPEPQASLRLAVCNNLQPLSDSSTEALDGLYHSQLHRRRPRRFCSHGVRSCDAIPQAATLGKHFFYHLLKEITWKYLMYVSLSFFEAHAILVLRSKNKHEGQTLSVRSSEKMLLNMSSTFPLKTAAYDPVPPPWHGRLSPDG